MLILIRSGVQGRHNFPFLRKLALEETGFCAATGGSCAAYTEAGTRLCGGKSLGDEIIADTLEYKPQLAHGKRLCARDRAEPLLDDGECDLDQAAPVVRPAKPLGIVAVPLENHAHGMKAPGPGVLPGTYHGRTAATRDHIAVCPCKIHRV